MKVYETDAGNIHTRNPKLPNCAVWDVAPEVQSEISWKQNRSIAKQAEKQAVSWVSVPHVM